MAITKDHELHKRRFSRNLGVGISLGVLVAIVMVLTVVKVSVLDPARNGTYRAPAVETPADQPAAEATTQTPAAQAAQ
ncbi:MAG: hypothetical protein ACRBBK_11355 [Paracoccaceae bacterium]